MFQPTVIIEFFLKKVKKMAHRGCNQTYMVVYYQWLIAVAFLKSGPESGPQTNNFKPY